MTDADDFLMGSEDGSRPWLVASYDGQCSECGGEISAGLTEIRSDGEGGWECCGE